MTMKTLIAEARNHKDLVEALADALEESEAQLAEALIEVRSRESWVAAWRAECKWARTEMAQLEKLYKR